jgi:hypothetical protein
MTSVTKIQVNVKHETLQPPELLHNNISDTNVATISSIGSSNTGSCRSSFSILDDKEVSNIVSSMPKVIN